MKIPIPKIHEWKLENVDTTFSYLSYEYHDYEITIEPGLFDKCYLAFYKNGNLIELKDHERDKVRINVSLNYVLLNYESIYNLIKTIIKTL